MNTPKPTPWTTLHPEDREEHRYFACPHYKECLSQAAQKRWQSFTCLYCPCNNLLKEEEWRKQERLKKFKKPKKTKNPRQSRKIDPNKIPKETLWSL